jgi:DNA-binding NarL/FixJ family response regulator
MKDGSEREVNRNGVLVIEDSEAIRSRLIPLVRRVPGVAAVEQAGNLQDGMACLRRLRPRITLLDLHVGDGGGTAIDQIMTMAPETVLIALTRYVTPNVMQSCKDHGVRYCFDKSSDLPAILDVVSKIVQDKETNRQEKMT